MNDPKERAALALEVFDSVFNPNAETADYLDECLCSALGISDFTKQACDNADFRNDNLSLSSLSETAGAAANQIKIARALVNHLRVKYYDMEACIREREAENRRSTHRLREIASKVIEQHLGGTEE